MDKQIEKVIDGDIRPQIQGDGGDIEFISFDKKTGTVRVRLHGACQGCPMSHVTLFQGVEKLLKEKIPEVKGVEVIE
ncbi:MAG: Nitrogen-fixing NifU domain protein [Parcubacteria group bacterium GW2011_GWA2_38_13]|nr:MAG: Nitrogen-fixing NifU domain protein [Parcubacteria group bacterium GW2011_GWA2_38_13]